MGAATRLRLETWSPRTASVKSRLPRLMVRLESETHP
jgi:hypothetical protein